MQKVFFYYLNGLADLKKKQTNKQTFSSQRGFQMTVVNQSNISGQLKRDIDNPMNQLKLPASTLSRGCKARESTCEVLLLIVEKVEMDF